MDEHTLSAEEQRFFETGELQTGMQPQIESSAIDPIALAGVGNATLPTIETPAAPAQPQQPTPNLPTNDAAEILRTELTAAQQRVGQLEQFIHQSTQPTQPQTTPPDPEIDPLGSMMHQLAAVNKTVQDLQAALVQQQTQQANASQFQQFQSSIRQLRDEFVKTAPDFDDAYKHLRTIREVDLRALGLQETAIKQALFQEEIARAEAAIRSGKNPVEAVYESAKRYGYAAKTNPQALQPQKPDAKLAAIKQAQSAAQQLPQSQAAEEFTMDGLKDASDADLSKFVMDDKIWSKIVGSDKYPL